MARTLTDDDLSRAFGELGIPPTVDMESISDAFKTRAKIVHPDRSAKSGQAPMQRLVNARDDLKEAATSGFLKAYVARFSPAWDSIVSATDAGNLYSVPRKVEDAFPDMHNLVIVHRVAPSTYILWASKSIVANNAKPRTICRILREMAGDAADAPDALVWVFVPNERKVAVQLHALPGVLAQLDPVAPAARESAERADSGTERSAAIPDEADAGGLSPEDIKAAALKQDWKGSRSSYVIYVGATAARKPSARVFLVRKIGTQRQVDQIGTAASSEGAVTLLAGRGVNQDVTPVFVIHEANPGEVMRLGAA